MTAATNNEGGPVVPPPTQTLAAAPTAEPPSGWLELRFHWLVIAISIVVPLWISRYILNSIVPCAFFNRASIKEAAWGSDLALQDGQCSFVLPSTVYRQLYEFGALATVSVVLAVAATVFAVRYISGSVSQVKGTTRKGRRGRWVLIVGCIAAIFVAQLTHLIDPHSCISGRLIDLAAGGVPEDKVCVEELRKAIPGFIEIGSLSSSLEDVFGILYPILISAAALVAIATGYVLATMIADMRVNEVKSGDVELSKAHNETLSAQATKDLTFLLTLLSGLFTFAIAMTNSYYAIGEKVLGGDAVKSTSLPANVQAYQDYEKAIALHWGGAGSATIALMFLSAVVIIAYWRERAKLPPFADFGKVGTLIFNLVLVGLPALVTQTQLAVKF